MRKLFFFVSGLLISMALQAKKNEHTPEREKPTVEGKIYFSNLPFTGTNSNTSKTTFTSAEYIYARLEIPSGTLKEVFKIKEDDKTMPYLKCKLTITQGGEVIPYGSTSDHLLIKDEFLNSTILNFDILPEPTKAATLYSMLEDFSAGYGFNPLSGLIMNGRWPDGDYKVNVKIYSETFNAYGSLQDEDKWPSLESEFDLIFKEEDAVKIIANSKLIRESSIENAFRYDKLPPVFSKPGALTDPNATAAKIAAILKRDLSERQILKWVAESYSGPVWHIATDDFGLPKYKYFNPHIWMAYKINGKCYVGNVTLRQVYSGGGTYGPLQVAYTSAGSLPDKGIDCIKVK
jgi:hypothetical protein